MATYEGTTVYSSSGDVVTDLYISVTLDEGITVFLYAEDLVTVEEAMIVSVPFPHCIEADDTVVKLRSGVATEPGMISVGWLKTLAV